MALIEMTIDSIRRALKQDYSVFSHPVILKSRVGERYLAIWVGEHEADSIGIKLLGIGTPRPLTHDLLRSVIETYGGGIDSVIISDLKGDTFYAKLVLTLGEKRFEVDCRPSDALALAVRTWVPIFAEEEVLDKAEIPTRWKSEATKDC